jgi:nucleotide-binding universal stress UspA family protein
MRAARHTKGVILLATDFSKPARRAYAYALKLSLLLNTRLVLLHIVKAMPDLETWSPAARRSVQSLRTKALLELGRMVRVAKDNGIAAEHKLIVGIPEDSVVKVAEQIRADFIAIGTHGRTGWDRLQLGNTAEALLRHARCPVLTVHASAVADAPVNPRRVKLKTILVALDFSASSDAGLRAATLLAERADARMILIHAAGSSGLVSRRRGRAAESADHSVDRLFQRAVEAAQAERSVIRKIVEPGSPVEVILDQAKQTTADLIVMGTNGRRGVERLLLGSVAESIVRRAGCPVLVAKPRPQDTSIRRGV